MSRDRVHEVLPRALGLGAHDLVRVEQAVGGEQVGGLAVGLELAETLRGERHLGAAGWTRSTAWTRSSALGVVRLATRGGRRAGRRRSSSAPAAASRGAGDHRRRTPRRRIGRVSRAGSASSVGALAAAASSIDHVGILHIVGSPTRSAAVRARHPSAPSASISTISRLGASRSATSAVDLERASTGDLVADDVVVGEVVVGADGELDAHLLGRAAEDAETGGLDASGVGEHAVLGVVVGRLVGSIGRHCGILLRQKSLLRAGAAPSRLMGGTDDDQKVAGLDLLRLADREPLDDAVDGRR